jgi:beta-lactamase class A
VPRIVALCVSACLVASGTALASDRTLLGTLDTNLSRTVTASRAAASGSPALVQVHYDRARTLQEQIRRAAPFSSGCHALGGWAARYAAAEVAAAEGRDRLEPARAGRARRLAVSALRQLTSARAACRPTTPLQRPGIPALVDPRPWAVSFGSVVARVPSVDVEVATLVLNGVVAGSLTIGAGIARGRITASPGRYDVEVQFVRNGEVVARARSADVWLLPAGTEGPVGVVNDDPAWDRQLADAAARFSGIAGIWIHDVASGRAAAWNAGAQFPAASTVKLGVMVEALRRMGPQPEESVLFHDVRAIGAWSSNLAANRLLGRVGGSSGVQAALRRMGATSSTYTGPYLVATGLPAITAPSPPPRVSGRITTAADLGTIMAVLLRGARGDAAALGATRMSATQARLALGLLLSSEAHADNLGLFREALGSSALAAQKHGWISSARHSAAIVYTDHGPVIMVVLTYKRGLTRAAAAALGAEVVRIAGAG